MQVKILNCPHQVDDRMDHVKTATDRGYKKKQNGYLILRPISSLRLICLVVF